MEDLSKKSSITVSVKASSPKTEIAGFYDGVYKLNAAAPAQNNKANIEIIKFFTKLTGKKVKIIKGKTSKIKVLKFE